VWRGHEDGGELRRARCGHEVGVMTGGRRRSASGGAGNSCPESWARNGSIRLAAVGLILGKEKERK
jgi:hypothetical protein